MGIAKCLCPEKGQQALIMRGLQKARWIHRARFLSQLPHERVHLLLRGCKNFPEIEREQRLLTSRNCQEDGEKDAFASHRGLFQSIRMPFGLKNALGTIQYAMDIILSTVQWQFALVYLELIMIFSKSLEADIKLMRQVLMLPRVAAVTI